MATKPNGTSTSTVHLQPTVPQGSVSLDAPTALEAGGEFLLDGKLADIKLAFGWKAPGVDVDASLAMYNSAGKCIDVIWWDKKTSRFCAIKHLGDDLTGEQEGNNELIQINIDEMPPSVHYMIAMVSVYSKGKYISNVENISMKILDTQGTGKNEKDVEIASFTPDLGGGTEDSAAAIMGIMTRKGAWWNFKAVGKSGRGRTVKEIVSYTPLETLTEINSVSAKSSGVYLWASEANDVAASDFPMFGKKSSDCFVEILCRGSRSVSEVVEKSLNPKWNMDKVFLGEATDSDFTAVEVNVWDHDTHTDDDFLGSVVLTLGGLVQKGAGVHEVSLPLGPSRDNEIVAKHGVSIKGAITLKCEVLTQ
ncbi:hypothetical protein BSKO_04709 [Bryopsis sp. KO-2023]|nr:hypothetical protein BSKO_04709 [Bryopsis sp. KO-2023]